MFVDMHLIAVLHWRCSTCDEICARTHHRLLCVCRMWWGEIWGAFDIFIQNLDDHTLTHSHTNWSAWINHTPEWFTNTRINHPDWCARTRPRQIYYIQRDVYYPSQLFTWCIMHASRHHSDTYPFSSMSNAIRFKLNCVIHFSSTKTTITTTLWMCDKMAAIAKLPIYSLTFTSGIT